MISESQRIAGDGLSRSLLRRARYTAAMVLLGETTNEGWRPGIGDPTVMGWLTVFAYALAAALCWRAAMVSGSSNAPHHRSALRLWIALAGLFVVLAINKQLDLQSWFTSIGRAMARSEGWYEYRRAVQTIFVIALAALGLIALLVLAWLTRTTWRTTGLAVIGTAFILTFIVIRAASFHHFDDLLGWTFFGMRMNWIFELSGIACVAFAAWNAQRPRTRRNQPVVRRVNPAHPTPSNPQQIESLRWLFDRSRQP